MKISRWVVEWKKRRRKIKFRTWWLIILLVPLCFADIQLLREDHIKMTELRDAVLQADVDEDDEKIADALIALKEFVFHNIVINVVEENGEQKVSFGTGPFYLEHQYLRAANQALEEAEASLQSDANPNGNVYGAASAVCQPQAIANHWSWNDANYINCMMTEIGKYPAANELQSEVIAALPSTELYRHNYASPVWAPTATGFCLLATLIILITIVVRFIIWLILRLSLLFI